MKYLLSLMSLICILCVSLCTTACRKEKGVCYCKYASGDKRHFDLKSLPRNEAVDSCAVISGNAQGFGGSCKLK
ncbi:MAG: hypothetical protein V4580_06515 [Bacteroidota bacterium]